MACWASGPPLLGPHHLRNHLLTHHLLLGGIFGRVATPRRHTGSHADPQFRSLLDRSRADRFRTGICGLKLEPHLGVTSYENPTPGALRSDPR